MGVFSSHCDLETTVNIIETGTAFITAAVFLDRIYLKSARSLTPSRLLLLPAAAVRTVFRTDPVFAHGIAKDLALLESFAGPSPIIDDPEFNSRRSPVIGCRATRSTGRR